MSAPAIRHEDAFAATPLTWVASAMIAQQVAGKAVRDGLFLSQLAVADLPKVMLASAVVAVPIVLAVSMGIRRFGPQRAAPWAFGINAGLFALEWALLAYAPLWAAVLVYLHVASFGGTLISVFWSAIGERFDPYSAKRAIGRITSGATLGGLAGGIFVSQTAHGLAPGSLLAGLALINLLCALGIGRLGKTTVAVPATSTSSSALASLGTSSYLRSIAYLVLLTGFVSALLDFGFKAAAAQAFGSGAQLIQSFAVFHTATAVLTLLVQTTLARRALDRLGLAGTLAILPASVLLTGSLGLALPSLWIRALPRAASAVLESSLFRSAYEPLYTPLSAETRRASKTIIDVAAGRLGEALGSGVVLLLIAVLAGSSAPVLPIAMLGAALALFLSLRMHTGYVAELASSLRSGAVTLRDTEALDSTTRLTLSQTHAEMSRVELLAQLAQLRGQPGELGMRAPVKIDGVSEAPPTAAASPSQTAHVALLSSLDDLLSAEFGRVQRVLELGPLDARLVPLAISLLQHARLVEPVTSALKAIAHSVPGQLVDALLDPTRPASVRRRIPRILKSANHVRAVHGLVEALSTPEREIRYRAALALNELIKLQPELSPEAHTVFAAVREEIKLSADKPIDLQHVFALLSLALTGDALGLARHALMGGDERQRGTALEYLQNVLPEPLRSELVRHLESHDGRVQASEPFSILPSD
jgi:AAA family ATP:ADP antiporter